MWQNTDTEGFFTEPNEVQSSGPKTTKQSTAVPVFIRSILNNNGQQCNMFGTPINMVAFMGVLKDHDVQSTKATYEIEDHTGKITCVYWISSDSDDRNSLPSAKIGSYCKVIGNCKSYGGKMEIIVLHMQQVDSPNAITSFGLEVIQARLELESSCTPKSMIFANNPSAALANSMSAMNNDQSVYGMNTLQEKVYAIIRSATGPTGASRSEILKQFPPAQHQEINAALLYLTDEGLAYTTTDQDLFKATDSM